MKEINKVLVCQQAEFALLWGVALGMFLVYECGWLDEGCLTGSPRVAYWAETLGILLTLALVPLTLKGFNRILVRRIRPLSLLEAVAAYHRWSLVRLGVLALLAWGNLWLYYATMNTIGGLCALIALAASLFCLPGRQRLMNDLEVVES